MHPIIKMLTSILGRLRSLIQANLSYWNSDGLGGGDWAVKVINSTAQLLEDPTTPTSVFHAKARLSRTHRLNWWFLVVGSCCETVTYLRDWQEAGEDEDLRIGARWATFECVASAMFDFLGQVTELRCIRQGLKVDVFSMERPEIKKLLDLKHEGKKRVLWALDRRFP